MHTVRFLAASSGQCWRALRRARIAAVVRACSWPGMLPAKRYVAFSLVWSASPSRRAGYPGYPVPKKPGCWEGGCGYPDVFQYFAFFTKSVGNSQKNQPLTTQILEGDCVEALVKLSES